MKNLIISIFIICLVFGCADHNRLPSMENSLSKLNSITMVTGSAVGAGGQEGDFFHLARIFIRIGQSDDFLSMLHSSNPITRLMGVYCLILTDKIKYRVDIAPIFEETDEVEFMPLCCFLTHEPVGKVAKLIYDDILIFGGNPKDSDYDL